MKIIKNLVREKGISAVMAIHDLNFASGYADRVIVLNGGHVIASGDPVSMFTPETIAHVYRV